ncbi:probable G-protein coupled receptor 139 [Rhincodon typus]|uniref:probable G-protein coupled receptor 139 n=1 Tax=Rhincodon typus TaxID=259920 RepID=UPI00202FE4BA|nr:probable G-protein coupled receptor 139 [Rhincodon typus]
MHGIPKGLVFAIYYPFIATIGVPANLSVILIQSRRRCGLSRCTTDYLISMAVADFLVILVAGILNRIAGIYFRKSFLSITPVCSLRSTLIYTSIDISVWLTVAFTFDRFVAICCQKLKLKHCTKKRATLIIGVISTVCCLTKSVVYFIYEPLYIIENVPWFCRVKSIFYTSWAWVTYDWFYRILTPCLPFILILFLNVLTVRHILLASRARRRLRVQNDENNQSDTEIDSRRKSIVLLFAISGSFILFYSLYFVTFLLVRISRLTYFSGSNYTNSNFILEETGFMLQLLSSCINPFIYAGTQSKFRAELKNGLKFPLSIIVKLYKR